MTLTEFLLARVAEDEAAVVDGGECRCGRGPQRPDCADRIAAECEAKRQIVEAGGSECGARVDKDDAELVAHFAELGLEVRPHWPDAYEPFCDGCAAAQSADLDHEWVLKVLARPHADHPDFNEDWRV